MALFSQQIEAIPSPRRRCGRSLEIPTRTRLSLICRFETKDTKLAPSPAEIKMFGLNFCEAKHQTESELQTKIKELDT